MTLIGRDCDRVTHVLVPEELEKREDPKFYFPETRNEEKAINLANVPFVPLRNLFPKEWGRMPGSFMGMVAQYSRRIQELVPEIKLKVYRSRPIIELNGTELGLAAREQLLMIFLADRAKNEVAPWTCQAA